jgi:signal transduction histidine kinase/ligand-binding sensor domain-containing protein/DNA-binding response OmpR family regulator
MLAILFALCGWRAAAQQIQFRFSHVDMSEGLSHNQVNCILKDSLGFLWFGTLSGLDRYDGYGFRVFRSIRGDTTSLSDNYVTAINPLPGGKLWISTRSGNDIYDPATEHFDRNDTAYLHSLHLPAGNVTHVTRDKAGDYWFVYEGAGIFKYRTYDSTVTHLSAQDGALSDDEVSAAEPDGSGSLWIVHHNGALEKLDLKTSSVTYRTDSLASHTGPGPAPYRLFADSDHNLWIYEAGDANGVFYFNTISHNFLHLSQGQDIHHLNNDIIYGITEDEKGRIWIATDHGGINLVDKKEFTVQHLMHNAEDPNSLAQNSVYALYRDNAGIIWVGTYKKGVCFYDEHANRFPLYSHDPNLAKDKTLPYEDVNRFVEDSHGNLWIGTNGGGLIYFDRGSDTFRQYLHDPRDPNSLSNNVIVGLYLDAQNKLWIGTYTGGMDCFDGKRFIHFVHHSGDSASLSNNRVWDIYGDSQGNLWVGTLGGGLERYDSRTGTFIPYRPTDPTIEGINYVLVISEDKRQRLWIGTAGGIEVLDLKTGRKIHFSHAPGNPESLSNDNINAIFQDSRGWIWIATREGLNVFNPRTGKFRTFTTADGLVDNTVLTVMEDREKRLWMSTPNGLSLLSVSGTPASPKFLFRSYDESDGLQGREFNEKSAFHTREGQLIFGGSNGFNMFDPTTIKLNTRQAPLIFTSFEIFNKPVRIGERIKNRVILEKSIAETKSITLPHGANDFSLVFASLGYTRSEKSRYAYKLQGFNTEWVVTGAGTHKATYTNLDPGTYLFQAKASNNDGVWSPEVATIRIRVLPPFWRTVWAYMLYALVVLGLLYLARSILLYRARMNFKIEHQQHEAQRTHELDMMKIRFFTNISHEFRTPLTLILTPLERMLKQSQAGEQNSQLQLIHRNARRLLHLVNQLLDFRKMEVQEISLHPVRDDILRFINEIVQSFTDIAEKKNIVLTMETAIHSLDASFDKDKLERILFNLLSNAFKFTPENGRVRVILDIREPSASEHSGSMLRIRVEDSGIGIPAEKQAAIFERFFQHETSPVVVNPGSGIGLAITREFVRLHNGSIMVDSTPGKGSCFTVLLPVDITPPGPATVLTTTFSREHPATGTRQAPKRYTLLLVEDNEDFRFYLKDNLSYYFNILEAANGNEGWSKALASHPDIIVTDIMMPEMNGIELAARLKKDARTNRIPVILLTARATEEQQLEGYQSGANDYITKPFNFEILLARIRNLLSEKRQQKKSEPPKVDFRPADIEIPSADETFLDQAIAIVEKNMGQKDFSVEQLSKSLFVSRVTLYKRLVAITGKTPIEFIRTIRLKRAAQLLEQGQMTVAQAAYEVGFNNPKYFSKYFRGEYGMLPSEFLQQRKSPQASGDAGTSDG